MSIRRRRRRHWLRHTGMHRAPRGGEVFPTGPVPARPVKAPRSHPEPLSRHELGETSADLLAPLARPYVPFEREG